MVRSRLMKETVRRLAGRPRTGRGGLAPRFASVARSMREILVSAFPDAYVRVLTSEHGLKLLLLDDTFGGMDTYKRVSAVMRPLYAAVEREVLTDGQVAAILSVDAFAPRDLV